MKLSPLLVVMLLGTSPELWPNHRTSAHLSPPPTFSIAGSPQLNRADSASVAEMISATLSVIGSDVFAERLAGVPYPALWTGSGGTTMTPHQVAEIYLGQHPVMVPMPSVVRVSKSPFKKSPSTGLTLNSPVRGTITLTKRELHRWRNGTLMSRSCVVNTLAHEITHTIAHSSENGHYVFSDGGHENHASQPFASYVVGGVAQCTMLERESAMQGSFAECVESRGTNFTTGAGCD